MDKANLTHFLKRFLPASQSNVQSKDKELKVSQKPLLLPEEGQFLCYTHKGAKKLRHIVLKLIRQEIERALKERKI